MGGSASNKVGETNGIVLFIFCKSGHASTLPIRPGLSRPAAG